MLFRNVTMFRFPKALDLSGLEQALGECALKPVGPLELVSAGFVSPLGRGAEALTHQVGDAIWLTVGSETRLLPGAVIAKELEKRVAALEKAEGCAATARATRRLRSEVIVDMLPRAFVRPGRLDVLIVRDLGLLAVNTLSRKAAESVVSEIRRALGSFPALPLNAEVAPRSVLTCWLAGEPMPEGLALGDECELRDPMDQGAIVKCQRQELQGDEIAKHLELGKQVTRLDLVLDDHAELVLGEDLVLRKLRMLDSALEALPEDLEDLRAELDARFALFAGELRRIFMALSGPLRISEVEA